MPSGAIKSYDTVDITLMECAPPSPGSRNTVDHYQNKGSRNRTRADWWTSREGCDELSFVFLINLQSPGAADFRQAFTYIFVATEVPTAGLPLLGCVTLRGINIAAAPRTIEPSQPRPDFSRGGILHLMPSYVPF